MDKTINYSSWEELAFDMDNDFERYPLPICFDAYEEQKELYGRDRRIKFIAKRWFSIYGTKLKTAQIQTP